MVNKKRWLSDVIPISEIEKWDEKTVVLISAGTGSGKSHFVKNRLCSYVEDMRKKITILVNRLILEDQYLSDLEKFKRACVETYQTVQTRKILFWSDNDYIVSDECHYYITDSMFNKKTDIALNEIMKQKATKIFMSATGEAFFNYIEDKCKEVYKDHTILRYTVPHSYDYIKSLRLVQGDEETVARRAIKYAIDNNIKSIFFIQSAQLAYKLYKEHKNISTFNCSKTHALYKHVDKNEINNIVKTSKFEKQLLFTTTSMDAGVNIKDTDVKFVYIDIKDIDNLVQCLGRRRIENKDDTISVAIRSINNNQLNGMVCKLKNQIAKAEYFISHGEEAYIDKYGRDNDENNIVYLENKECNKKINIKLNELMYYKRKTDMKRYNKWLYSGGFNKNLLRLLSIDKNNTKIKEISMKIETASEILERYYSEGTILYSKEDKKKLAEAINLRRDGHLISSAKTINADLESNDMMYTIKEFRAVRPEDKKVFRTAWKIYKLVNGAERL